MTFAVDSARFAAAGPGVPFAVRACISRSAIHEVESRMDVAGRNSAVECRSAQAWIAYCLSGLVACRNRCGLVTILMPGPGLVSERSCFIGGGRHCLS